MRHWLALLICLAFVLPAFAQDDDDIFYLKKKKQKVPVSVSTQYPGWTLLQETFSTANGNGGNFGSCSSQSGGQTCQMGIFSTTTGSAWVFMVNTTNNVAIDGACAGTNCSVGTSFANGWTKCSNCQKTQGSGNIDMAYATTGASGTVAVTLHLNGAPGAQFFVWFAEVLPPAGFTATFDNSASVSSASCTSCTLAAPTITGTDAVVHFPVTAGTSVGPNPINIFTNPYLQDFNGILFGLNVTSSDAVQSYPQASNTFIDGAVAFKTTLGFTRSADTQFYQMVQQTNNSSLACNPTCTFNWPVNSGGSHLIMVMVGDGNSQYITSAVETASGQSLTVPAGCQVAMSGVNANRLSCAYLLSSTSGKAGVTITMGGNSTIGISMWEISRVSGSFALDGSIVTGQDSSCSLCNGTTLSPTGAHGDVQFQAMFCPGGCNATTLYPNASNVGTNGAALTLNSSAAALLNTNNGTANIWGYTSGATSVLGLGFD